MPSDRDATRRWLNDIGHHIAVAQTFIEGMSYEVFRDDLRTTYAVIRCLEIISEASRRLPDDLKARHPAIALKNMAAAGNIYRHDYEDVAASFVWLCCGITCQRCVPSSSRSWRPSTNHDLRRSKTGRQFRVESGHTETPNQTQTGAALLFLASIPSSKSLNDALSDEANAVVKIRKNPDQASKIVAPTPELCDIE